MFQVNSLRVKADAAFDSNSDSNSGLFLLEQLTLNQVDHTAIVRLWKDVTENDNGSFDAKIYAEVSWPAGKPYYARDKEVFSLQLSKAPVITIDDATYNSSNCTITKVYGCGYSTTISSATGNININNGQSISGSGTLVAGGTFELNDINGLVGAASSKLFLYAMGDDIHFNNCVNVTANCIFYSPNYGLKFNNVSNVSVNGGIYVDSKSKALIMSSRHAIA